MARQHLLPLGFTLFFIALVGAALAMAARDFASGRATAVSPLPTNPASNPEQIPVAEITAVVAIPTLAPTAEPVSQQTYHTVQNGETLFRIATQYGFTVADIAAANNLTDPSLIYIGQVLTIPTNPTPQPTIQPTPQPTIQPTIELTPPPTTSHQQPATNHQQPATLNNIPLESIIVMPEAVRQNVRAIYAAGQALGRNPHAFAKIGDSTTHPDHFLSRFDSGPYNLGDYAYLQEVIEQYRGSFGRHSAAVRIGLHAWTVFDPIYADKSICLPNEDVIACEFRLHNPAIVLVRLGANDIGAPSLYESNMRQIVQFSIENGVIPVLGTKADRREGSNQNNDILRQIAADYQIPLWEFDIVAGTLPGRGLDVDGVHMNTFYAHDYTQPLAFQRGHAMHNLSALMALDAIWRLVVGSWELIVDS
jgi:LysM repeat protein